MARNEEKQLARLNRLLLQNKHDEERKKNPRRPDLSSLDTAADIKKWLPSIKRDLEFCLQQMKVPCYPERKIDEYKSRIFHLKGEYKAFIQKLKDLEGNPVQFQEPWIDRPYQGSGCKRTFDSTDDESSAKALRGDGEANNSKDQDTNSQSPKIKRIPLPILDGEEEQLYSLEVEPPVIVWNCDPSRENEKLDFSFDNDAVTTVSAKQSTKNQEDVPKDRSPNLLVEYSSSDSECDK